MNTQLQLAVDYLNASDYELRSQERIKLIKRAAEAARDSSIKTRTTKVWRTMPDHHYNLNGVGDGERPHHCQHRAEVNGM